MMKEPKDDDNEAYAVLSFAGPENKKIHLKALSCSDSELEVKSKGDVQVCKFKTQDMMTNQIFDFTKSMKEVKEASKDAPNPSIRFMVLIEDDDLLKTDKKHFDTRFKNTL